MPKARVIVADTDINYIIPLQLKFAEEFFDAIDLEIISDRSYFEELFASPQKADILVVSEELYDTSLQRHSISNIFLMTEQYEENQTAELNVNRIFKYTSIKEIFNEIIGKSASELKIQKENQKPKIVLVYSACGGTGKTTIALGIAAALTQNYKKVLYINAARLQTFQCRMENQTPITANDVYAKLGSSDENLYNEIKHIVRHEDFFYLPPFKAAIMSLGIEYSIYSNIASSAKKSEEFDFIIVDADSTFDEDKAALLGLADKVIIVTEQSLMSVTSTNRLVSNINNSETDKYLFVCNDFSKDEDNYLISPDVTMKFTVSEYIEHFAHCEKMSIAEFSKKTSIQKTAFLVI